MGDARGRPRALQCYVCERAFNARQLVRLIGDDNILKRHMAISKRDDLGRQGLALNDESRICFNCNAGISDEIQLLNNDPTCLRLNVLTQTRNSTCVICNAPYDIHRLSIECRINAFIERNIYVSPNVRSCEHHLDEDGLFIPILLPGLQFINRPLRIDGQEIATFLEHLRVRANKPVGLDIAKLSDEEFKCIAPITKDQFEELHVYCDSVIHNGKRRYISIIIII
ncbi:hypothetical protein CBL_20233 [Carabus blaptoides fortunei]